MKIEKLKTMKNKIRQYLKLSFFLFALIAISKDLKSQAPTENATLWKISGNGLSETSYLFGTIHMMCKEDYKMSDRVVEAVQKSDRIALELDMDDPQLQVKMQKLSVSPEMKNIKENLSAEEVTIVDNYFKSSYGSGIAQVGVLKPFVLSSMVMINSAGCEIVQYEAEFVKLAQHQEKELIGLETVEFQFGLFDELDYESQVESLVESIQYPEKTKALLNEMQSAYLAKDLQEIESLMEEHEEIPGFNEKLLDERNQKWISEISEYSKNASVFYAVGVGHLPGSKGVIALLREAGYEVNPVD